MFVCIVFIGFLVESRVAHSFLARRTAVVVAAERATGEAWAFALLTAAEAGLPVFTLGFATVETAVALFTAELAAREARPIALFAAELAARETRGIAILAAGRAGGERRSRGSPAE